MKSFVNKVKAVFAIIFCKNFHLACSDMKLKDGDLEINCYYYCTVDFLHFTAQAAEDNMNDVISEEDAVDEAYSIINPN